MELVVGNWGTSGVVVLPRPIVGDYLIVKVPDVVDPLRSDWGLVSVSIR